MSRTTGVDLVISGRDESGPIFGAFERRLREAEGTVATAGKRISNDFAGKLGGALAGLMGVQAIDRALREFREKLKDGADATDAGLAAAETFAAGLKSFPIAGVVGEWLGDVFDFGGDLATERAQQASRKIAEQTQQTERQLEEVVARMRQDTLTEEERRRQEFERQIAPLLKAREGTGTINATRERLEREYEAQEERRRQREQQAADEKRAEEEERERQRQQAAEEKRLEQEERERQRQTAEAEKQLAQEQRERERVEQNAARERERAEQEQLNRLEQLRRAEERLSGAVDRGSVSERTLMFQNERQSETGATATVANASSATGAQSIELQKRSKDALEEIESYQRDALDVLRDLAGQFPGVVEI